MVFFRRRGNVEVNKATVWKKYSVAYSGTAREYYNAGTGSIITYYDGFDFPADGGDPTLSGKHSAICSTKNYKYLIKKIYSNQYMLRLSITQNELGSDYITGSYIEVTAATARSLAIAGDYIEDVESEDPNAYPDNGPLGLYYYVKQ